VTPRHDQVLQNPAALVGLLVTGQIVVWTLAPALTHSAPPLDMVEGYMWGREWVIATYKHPALPSWVLEASRVVTGAVGWPAYIVAQLFVAAAFVFAYLLGRDMMGPRRAAAGTLLLTGVAFYAWPTPEFNHNVAEMPFWAGLPFALWRAVERRGIGWWALAGALAAGGLYAKLTTALLLATLAGWIVWDARARQSLATPGPWVGAAVFALLAAPLAIWLVAHDFAPLKYAASRSARVAGDGVHIFLLSIILNLGGMLAMLAVAGLIRPGRRRGTADRPLRDPPPAAVPPRALHYLMLVTSGPLVLAIISALITGSSLKSAWGSSMFNLAGILAVALTSKHFDGEALRRIVIFAAALVVAVPTVYALVIVAGPMRAGAPLRVIWPQAEISKRLTGVWARETGRPLKIVAGDAWTAGLVGITAPDKPSILTQGDRLLSPWITPERLAREGALVVWDAGGGKPVPPRLQQVIGDAPVRQEAFPWRRSKERGDLAIGYAVVPPR
jgi:4-amino-4-deoxy-L-arabinose transferase-like glycosyltransferase